MMAAIGYSPEIEKKILVESRPAAEPRDTLPLEGVFDCATPAMSWEQGPGE